MIRRPAIGFLIPSFLSLGLGSGYQPASQSEAAPAVNGVDYGANKMPPAARLAPKKGLGARSPGAPPARR